MTVAPIVRFALAYAAGVAAGLLSVPVWISLLVVSIGVILPAPALPSTTWIFCWRVKHPPMWKRLWLDDWVTFRSSRSGTTEA